MFYCENCIAYDGELSFPQQDSLRIAEYVIVSFPY
jgi:hypothetical protein